MEPDADASAYDELSRHARALDIASIAARVMTAAAEPRRRDDAPEGAGKLTAQEELLRDEASTTFGNAFEVLAHGPAGERERPLARALAAHALSMQPFKAMDDRQLADAVLRLSAHTPFDATTLLDRALGERAEPVWREFADCVRRADSGAPSIDRGEALVAATALATADGPAAASLAGVLASEVRDPKLSLVLRGNERTGSLEPLRGEWSPSPRSPVIAVLAGLSGVSLVLHVSRIVGRIALAYRRPAEVRISDDGGVRIKWHVELLGRTLSERDVVVPPAGLARAAREVRYPRLKLYAGLLALAVGSYVGMHAFIDGLRAASPSLVAAGLFVVAVSFAVDLALTSIAPGVRGRCRMLFVPRGGRALCVGGVDIARADTLLNRLARAASPHFVPGPSPQRESDDSMRSPRTASSRPADA